MTSTLSKRLSFVVVIFACLFLASAALAQERQTLALSPTLIDIKSEPGSAWSSSLKVINSNSYPLTVYGTIVNFTPEGEGGQGRFELIPATEQTGDTLAEWVSLTEPKLTIPAQSSAAFSFTVNIPDDADPGSHFAAILVGTEPPQTAGAQSAMVTSQVVTSLFFLNVDGEIIEDGLVRSFVSTNAFASEPHSEFELRFENRGNVQLQPQGDIVIYNMWGKERGRIPINYNTSFGRALPARDDFDGIRRYTYAWTGEFSLRDIGLYRAEATLAYGSEARQFASAATYFWVVPVKALLITLSLIAATVLLILWSVRRYIESVFKRAGFVPGGVSPHANVGHELRIGTRNEPATPQDSGSYRASSLTSFDLRTSIANHRTLLIRGLVVAACVAGALFIYQGAVRDSRSYQVEIGNAAESTSYNSEEVAFMRRVSEGLQYLEREGQYRVVVKNASGRAGSAGVVAAKLALASFPVNELHTYGDDARARTTILFPSSLQFEALEISDVLGGVLLSAEESADAKITILVGADAPTE